MKTYKTKAAAINGMWRLCRKLTNESPLVGDEGTTLQWVDNGKTRSLSVRRNDSNYYDDTYLLVDSVEEIQY